jgi:hypothetical protein
MLWYCPKCKGDNADDQQICGACGCDMLEEALAGVNKNAVVLKDHYALIYQWLKDLAEDPKKELRNNPNLERFVRGPHDLEILEKLPAPDEIEPIDIICLADSISRGRLEQFYQLRISKGQLLGDYVREKILLPFGNKILRTEFTLLELYVPEMPK